MGGGDRAGLWRSMRLRSTATPTCLASCSFARPRLVESDVLVSMGLVMLTRLALELLHMPTAKWIVWQRTEKVARSKMMARGREEKTPC